MREIGRTFCLAALLAGPAFSARAAVPDDLDRFVAESMKTFGAPGVSVAIVEDGKTVLAKGYGVRSIVTRAPVDSHTAFQIGSETKAFTAAAIALLVDEGKLTWDDRVVDRLPGFQMYDPYVTEHMTIRDLLSHRSGLGLGEGDLLLLPASDRSRMDVVRALRFLKPKTGFRETYAYDNILYIAAGALIEAVSGQSWEDFVRTRILRPVGMDDSLVAYDPKAPNAVGLHGRTGGVLRSDGALHLLDHGIESPASGPAGMLNCSAEDMAKWMRVVLARGELDGGKRLYSETQARELWTPQVIVPSDPFAIDPSPVARKFQTYALGWFVEDYHGHTIVEHAGGVFGGVALLALIPEKGIGISVAINSEDSGVRRAIVSHLIDHYLGLPHEDWNLTYKALFDKMRADTQKALAAPRDEVKANDAHSLSIKSYAGAYQDVWYGPVTVKSGVDGKLSMKFDHTPGMEGPLLHVGDDVFKAVWGDPEMEPAYVKFLVKDGAVSQLKMWPASPVADFSFDYADLDFRPVH